MKSAVRSRPPDPPPLLPHHPFRMDSARILRSSAPMGGASFATLAARVPGHSACQPKTK
jgi:hypothetical protein